MQNNTELDICHYCARRGRKRNLAKVTWLVNGHYTHLCPHCTDKVIRDMMTLEWNRVHGYKIEYPYREGE